MWKTKAYTILTVLLLPTTMLSCSDSSEEVIPDFSLVEFADSTMLAKSIEACKGSKNRNKSVGVLGGSLASNPESAYAIHLWKQHLGMRVTQYGMGGYAFAAGKKSIQSQADRVKKQDIYILWASTNDYTQSFEAGQPEDYTGDDGFDPAKLSTQCGGMNYCIQQLRKVNPQATIYIFGSLKFFADEEGYQKDSPHHNATGANFYSYVVKQEEVAQRQGLPFFNQFDIPCNTLENAARYYKEDRYHMTAEGYANIGVYQLFFLATESELIK